MEQDILDVFIEGFEFIVENLEGALGYLLKIVAELLFSLSYGLFSGVYSLFRDFLFDCKDLFSFVGEDVLSLFFDDIDTSSFMSVNLIYWVIGIMVVLFIFKKILWKLLVACYQWLSDLITPL